MKRIVVVALLAVGFFGASITSADAGDGKSSRPFSTGSGHKFRGFGAPSARSLVNPRNRFYYPSFKQGWSMNRGHYQIQPYWGRHYHSRYRNQWGRGNHRAPVTPYPYYNRFR